MECSLIQAALDWECLPQQAREEYQNHLRTCAACRKRISREAPDKLLFLVAESEKLPEDFWLGFWDSLQPKLEKQRETKMTSYLSFLRWTAVFCAAALLISFERATVKQMSSVVPPARTAPATESFHYPLVEDINNPRATYYIFEPNDNEKIVMILDPDMDL